jgi:hypothetical protein
VCDLGQLMPMMLATSSSHCLGRASTRTLFKCYRYIIYQHKTESSSGTRYISCRQQSFFSFKCLNFHFREWFTEVSVPFFFFINLQLKIKVWDLTYIIHKPNKADYNTQKGLLPLVYELRDRWWWPDCPLSPGTVPDQFPSHSILKHGDKWSNLWIS